MLFFFMLHVLNGTSFGTVFENFSVKIARAS